MEKCEFWLRLYRSISPDERRSIQFNPLLTCPSPLRRDDKDIKYITSLSIENQRYLENNPEMAMLTNGFISAVRAQKSPDLLRFSADYFTSLSGAASLPPIVFAGPSGVGKGTLVNLLMTRYPEIFGFSVSNTTRQPR